MTLDTQTIIAVVTGLTALVLGISAYRKDKSEATHNITGSAIDLIKEFKEQVKELKQENRAMDNRINALEDNEEEMKDGIMILIRQLRELGVEPAWRPKWVGRGSEDGTNKSNKTEWGF